MKLLEKNRQYSPKWWFHGDLPWYKAKSHQENLQILATGYTGKAGYVHGIPA